MSDSQTLVFTKEHLWAIHSRRSLQKSDLGKLLSLLFKKEQWKWFAHDSSKSLSKNAWFAQKIYFSYVFDSLPPFFCSRHSSLICSFVKKDLSDLLLSLFKKIDCERFTQVTHDKSDGSDLFFFTCESLFCSQKISELLEFPTLW